MLIIFREIYKDAFAPQPLSQRAKPWEKASVLAHAPRLQGQKIWKKARKPGAKSQSIPESNAAQLELETEGMGARKKQRVIGGKENISDASWLLNSSGNEKNMEMVNGSLSPKKKDRQSLGNGDADALLVPRKRTNGNHLITPRKSSRKAPLQAVELNAGSPNYRTLSVHSPSMATADAEEVAMIQSAEKPRRRKSIRKSSRRQTLLDMAKEAVPTSFDDLPEPSQIFVASSKNIEEAVSTQAALKFTRFQPADITFNETEPQAAEPILQPIEPDIQSALAMQDAPTSSDQENQIEDITEAQVEKQNRRRSSRNSTCRIALEGLPAEVPYPIQAAAVPTTPQRSAANLEQTPVTNVMLQADIFPCVATPDETLAEVALGEGSTTDKNDMDIEQPVFVRLNEVVTLQLSTDPQNNPAKAAQSTEYSPTHEELVKAVEELPLSPAKKALLALIVKTETETYESHYETPGTIAEGKTSPEPSGQTILPDLYMFGGEAVLADQTVKSLPTPTDFSLLKPTKALTIQLSPPAKHMATTKANGSETPKGKGRTPRPRATRRSTRTRASSIPVEEVASIQDSVSANHSAANITLADPISVRSPVKPDIAVYAASITDLQVTIPAADKDSLKTDAEVGGAVLFGYARRPNRVENATLLDAIVFKGVADQELLSTATPQTEHEVVDPSLSQKNDEDADASLQLVVEYKESDDIVIKEAEDSDVEQVPTETYDIAPIQELLKPEPISKSSDDALQVLDPVSVAILTPSPSPEEETLDELISSTTSEPTSSTFVEQPAENGSNISTNHDDTDMLLAFLTRVKANKAAKAQSALPKRKRSLPHSPLQIPLGSASDSFVPSSPKEKDEFDVSLPASSSKRRKREPSPDHLEDTTQPQSIRRSGRTRLPVKATVAAPSFIPVRRLGQDGDSTVTLRRNDDKEFVALTKVNTRKNKGTALLPVVLLARLAEDKENPASRQRALKEAFDEKNSKQKGKKAKSVVWAEELARYQTADGGEKAVTFEKEVEKENSVEEKKAAVKVGMRNKMGLGMAANGTPAPKRKMRGRS